MKAVLWWQLKTGDEYYIQQLDPAPGKSGKVRGTFTKL